MTTPDPGTPSPRYSEPADPLVGALLVERYRIRSKLGEGGMGVVYEGEHELIGRRVAIKCLHAQYARRTDVVTRFHREALAVSRSWANPAKGMRTSARVVATIAAGRIAYQRGTS